MTFESENITHILITCPRGFANERGVVPIPAYLAGAAETLAHHANPEGRANHTELYTLAQARPEDRSAAGHSLAQLSKEGLSLEEYLGSCLPSLFDDVVIPAEQLIV